MFSHPITHPRPAASIAPQLLEFATELATTCETQGSVTIAKGSAEYVSLMSMIALAQRQGQRAQTAAIPQNA
jgi:phosphotransferase system HPr-like phosphotransfer protein